MPYIAERYREDLDAVVDKMLDEGVQSNGELNYVLFKYCLESVESSYQGYKNYIGELNECVAEIRRRLLAPYEDKKLIENGDVI